MSFCGGGSPALLKAASGVPHAELGADVACTADVSCPATHRTLQALMLLSQKVLLRSRLTAMMLKRMPKEEGTCTACVGVLEASMDVAC